MTTTEPTTKRICVVGLFANQARMVARKTAHLASAQLRFIDGNPAHRPDPLPDAVDYVIFSRFTDHSRYAEARAKYAPDTVFFCKGGASMIIQKIFTLTNSTATTTNLITPPPPTGNNMGRTIRVFSEEFRASAVQLAHKLTVPIAAAQLGVGESSLYNWVAKAKPDLAGAGDAAPARRSAPNSDRVYWTDEELLKVADEWVMLHVDNPLTRPSDIFEKAQRKALPGDRQRTIASVNACKPLVNAILKAWKNFLVNSSPAPAPLPPPEPVVIEIEVPRPLTFAEMLELCDEPALDALRSAKRLQRESQFHQLLAASVGHHNNGAKVPAVKPFVPRMEIYDAGLKQHPRIAIVGQSSVQHDELLAAVKTAALPAVIRYAEGKDTLAVNRCDFAIMCRQNGHGATRADSDRTINNLGRDRVILLENGSVETVLQQVRNICSRK